MKYRFLILCVVLLGIPAFAAFPDGDLDRNFIVDFDDLVLFAQHWAQAPDCFNSPGCADLIGNNDVNFEDFALLAGNWQQYTQIPLAINELMASNDTTLEDPDEPGEYPDWIEIYNYGTEAIPLTGMVLADSANTYLIPSGVDIAAGQYLVFYADEEPGQGPLHTNFKLGAGGDEVTLLSYDGQTLVDTVSFSDQTTDISYGRYEDATDNWYTMDAPSPSLTNNVGQAGEVYFSRLSGTFTSTFNLELSTTTPSTTIRYTTDGSMPTAGSTTYTGPVPIGTSSPSRVRARAYHATLAPGNITSHYYTPLASDVQSFTSTLPIVILNTHGDVISEGSQVHWPSDGSYGFVSSVFIDVNKDTGLASMQDIPDHAGRAGLKTRGESSNDWPKKQFSLELWDETNNDEKHSLLGMSSESDWVLNAPYGDKTFIRNVLAFKWANDIEEAFAAPGTRLVEVFLNDDSGSCSYADYNGIYVLLEKIKISDNRLDIGKLNSTDTTSPEVTGGYILRVDKNFQGDFEDFRTAADIFDRPIQYFDPEQDVLVFEQKQYIQSFLNTFETDLNGSEFNDPVAGYAQHVDVESFIEYDIIAEIFKNADGLKLSTYFHKEKNGKLGFGPHWDYNLSAGNTRFDGWSYPEWFARADTSEGWFNPTMPVYAWHDRMMDDIDHQLRTADKWFEHREDKLSDTQLTTDINDFYNLLTTNVTYSGGANNPADRNFNRWDILNQWKYCNYYYGYNPYESEQANMAHTYSMEIEWLKNWFNGSGTPTSPEWYKTEFTDRMGNLDAFWASNRSIDAPPTLLIDSSPMNTGGTITAGATLTMTGPSGTIYYTTDGTDPREWTYRDLGEPDPGVDPFTRTLVAENASKKALVPSSSISENWKGGVAFVDSSWISTTDGVGYDTGTSYDQYIGYDVEGLMLGGNNTCYTRTPFAVGSVDLPDIDTLKLRIRFDDAFVAYINGTEVARSSLAADTPAWDSNATGYTEPETDALIEFDITAYISELVAGSGNILAVHGMNSGNTSSDFLISFELEASSAGVPGSGGGELIAGGAVSPTAVAYSGGIVLNDSVQIKARVKNGSNWTALNEAIFSDSRVASSLRITEVMYNPVDPNDEFIEFKNIGPATINLAHCQLTKGVDFTFPDYDLAPNDHVLVVRNLSAFSLLHPALTSSIAGEYTNDKLDNGGENIRLKDAAGVIIQEFDYEDGWFPVTDGLDYSINIIDPTDATLDNWNKRVSWEASNVAGGTPGADHTDNAVGNEDIVINEILTHTDDSEGDWIELHNTTGSSIDVSGWYLSDDKDNLKKYKITSPTNISGGGYLVLTATTHFQNASNPGSSVQFGLSEHGESVFLTSGNGSDIAGGYSDSESFGSSKKDITFGRYTKSALADYNVDFVELTSMTQGAANDPAYVPDVVISEIMYNAKTIQDQLGEYIELYNRSGTTVYLYDLANTDNTWKFTKGIDFTFPTGVSIGGGQRILISRTHPEAFKVANSDPGVAVYGPFASGTELENDGEKIELSMPTDPDPGTGFISYIRVEQVNYSDGIHPLVSDPWPASADGRGDSLHRTTLSDYANDVANWSAATPTPGS